MTSPPEQDNVVSEDLRRVPSGLCFKTQKEESKEEGMKPAGSPWVFYGKRTLRDQSKSYWDLHLPGPSCIPLKLWRGKRKGKTFDT